MPSRPSKRVREQVMVYLDRRDYDLLDAVTRKTGLPKTEVLRRGLRRLADETLAEPGQRVSAIDTLIGAASPGAFPSDISTRPDYYLYGGGYDAWQARQKPRPRRARTR